MSIAIQIEKNRKQLEFQALKLARNSEDARDLYQDTVLRVLANQDRYRPNTHFLAWTSTIMRNLFINDYRKKKTHWQFLQQQLAPEMENLRLQVRNEGESNLQYLELLDLVAELPQKYSEPFLMLYCGYKYHEIARTLDKPVGTIKSQIFQARRRLRILWKRKNG